MTDSSPSTAPRKRGRPTEKFSARSMVAMLASLGESNRSKSSAHRTIVIGRRMTEELSAAITASGIRQSNPVLLEIVSEPTYEAQLAKLAEIVARQAAGRRIPTPAERWNATVRAFERLTEDHKMLFCARLIEAGYSPEDSE